MRDLRTFPVALPYVNRPGLLASAGISTAASGPFFGLCAVDFTLPAFLSSLGHSVATASNLFNLFSRLADRLGEGAFPLIELTRLNGSTMVLNSDLIKTAEASPDTMLTLINGEKLIVREEIAEVVESVIAYRARLLATVARRAPAGELDRSNIDRIAGLTSLDLTRLDLTRLDPNGQSGPQPLTKCGPKRDPVREPPRDR
jgi:flagellar protein FlbD